MPRHLSITQMHVDIIDMIGWPDPILKATTRRLDTFPYMHQDGHEEMEREIKTDLRIL